MDERAAKLALARKKLKDHQEKKLVVGLKDDVIKSKVDQNPYTLPQSEHKTNDPHYNVPPIETTSMNVQHYNVPEIDNTIDTIPHVIDNSIKEESAYKQVPENDINVTEILISNKRSLEIQVADLQSKLQQLEENYNAVTNDYKNCFLKVNALENELQNINTQYVNATKEISIKDAHIIELNSIKTTLTEKNNNLKEQLEFTKSILRTKEIDNDSLHTQLYNLQNQHDVIHLQLQQLTTGSSTYTTSDHFVDSEKYMAMSQKIESLEQHLKQSKKERDQLNMHYEHYVSELNKQLKAVMKKNEELAQEVNQLSDRETSLIEHISNMEIRLQKFQQHKKDFSYEVKESNNLKELEDDFKRVQDELSKLQIKHEYLQNQYAESVSKFKELSEEKENCNHDNISLTKLNADMASDKVAAQRATEQNKKLKEDLQRLEDDFVKMSKDKLELTEKLTAEKYLNRELTIKLAEIDEKAKEMQVKLKAKDEEMIRLQSTCREMEKQHVKITTIETNGSNSPQGIIEEHNHCDNHNEHTHCQSNESYHHSHESHHHSHESHHHNDESHHPVENNDQNSIHITEEKSSLQRDDAMMKLQERFLKIMGDVADLSDEKHRLEHIILQLQTETDTICEYVALYQQQRSLLKRRDEERSAQLKIFQQECGKLKCELEELSGILVRLAADKELSPYFQTESRRIDLEKVMTLLSNLKNNSLIDPIKQNVEFNNFYPCNCCSGKLIDV